VIKSNTIGSAAGIQHQGVIDKSESIGVRSLNNAVIVGRFKRGRMDRPFKVTIDNYKVLLGREPLNPSYMAVDDAFERGIDAVYVLRVGNSIEVYMKLLKDAYEVAFSQGFSGSQKEWLDSLVGRDGLSAYDIAVSNGYEGTIEQWVDVISIEHTKVVGAFGDSMDDAVSQKFMTDTINQTIGDIGALLDLINGE